jgi:TupA-like ATPgrasp
VIKSDISASLRAKVLQYLPSRVRFAMRYMAIHRRPSLLIRPRTFNEKLSLRLAIDRRPLLVTLSDKIKMRDYITAKIGPQVLNNILWVGKDAFAIPFDDLPKSFVIKTNHGSGFVRIVTDKSAINRGNVIREAESWLRFDYGKYSDEWAYLRIDPLVVIEEFIKSNAKSADGVPWDYKFFVFDGKCAMIQVDVNRFSRHARTLFTPQWELIPAEFTYPQAQKEPPPPDKLHEMLRLAEAAGKGIDFVRVDIYDSHRGPIIGEMTCFPEGATGRFSPSHYDDWLGNFWKFNAKA